MYKQVYQTVRYHNIEEDKAGQRLDNFLLTFLKNIPKTRIYRMVRKGEVRINGKRATVSYRLKVGDEIRIPPLFEKEKPSIPLPSASLCDILSQSILVEDDYILVINKPSGIPVHGGTRTSMGVIEAMRALKPEYSQLELVHRLDLETSGCLLLAKKRSALRELHRIIRIGEVHKVYLALTKGCWPKKKTRVTARLKKNHFEGGERIVKVDDSGKDALTVFKPINAYLESTLVEAVLHTGRTHQIRVHASSIEHPLAGDKKYGNRLFNKQLRTLGLKRMFLHACRLKFILPNTGKTYLIEAPLPNDLKKILSQLE